MGQNQSALQQEETSTPSSSAVFASSPVEKKPIELVMKDQARYIPKGLGRRHNGLIMPTYDHHGRRSNGDDSPGYGFYVDITAEVHHCSDRSPPEKDENENNKTDSSNDVASSQSPSILSNPAFGKGRTNVAMHWPSVPL